MNAEKVCNFILQCIRRRFTKYVWKESNFSQDEYSCSNSTESKSRHEEFPFLEISLYVGYTEVEIIQHGQCVWFCSSSTSSLVPIHKFVLSFITINPLDNRDVEVGNG